MVLLVLRLLIIIIPAILEIEADLYPLTPTTLNVDPNCTAITGSGMPKALVLIPGFTHDLQAGGERIYG